MFCGGFGRFGFGASGFGGMFIAMGFRILILVAIIVLGIKLFKSYTNKPNNSLRILDESFAKGEISEEEYLKRRTILSQKN